MKTLTKNLKFTCSAMCLALSGMASAQELPENYTLERTANGTILTSDQWVMRADDLNIFKDIASDQFVVSGRNIVVNPIGEMGVVDASRASFAQVSTIPVETLAGLANPLSCTSFVPNDMGVAFSVSGGQIISDGNGLPDELRESMTFETASGRASGTGAADDCIKISEFNASMIDFTTVGAGMTIDQVSSDTVRMSNGLATVNGSLENLLMYGDIGTGEPVQIMAIASIQGSTSAPDAFFTGDVRNPEQLVFLPGFRAAFATQGLVVNGDLVRMEMPDFTSQRLAADVTSVIFNDGQVIDVDMQMYSPQIADVVLKAVFEDLGEDVSIPSMLPVPEELKDTVRLSLVGGQFSFKDNGLVSIMEAVSGVSKDNALANLGRTLDVAPEALKAPIMAWVTRALTDPNGASVISRPATPVSMIQMGATGMTMPGQLGVMLGLTEGSALPRMGQ